MQLRHQVTTLVFLLLQTCPVLMRDFLGKILSFHKTSHFLWGPLPFPTSPTSPETHHLFLPTSIFLLGRAFAGKRGGLSWWLLVWFCHLLINTKKCTDSSVGSSDTLFRMPGPHSPPLWVLVANWGITGKDPTQILCSGTSISLKAFVILLCHFLNCLSKPGFEDLQEAALGTSVQLTGKGIYCQQDKDRKRWAINWQVIWSLFLVGNYVRVMKRVKFNLWL